jgi:hypothetical protein
VEEDPVKDLAPVRKRNSTITSLKTKVPSGKTRKDNSK